MLYVIGAAALLGLALVVVVVSRPRKPPASPSKAQPPNTDPSPELTPEVRAALDALKRFPELPVGLWAAKSGPPWEFEVLPTPEATRIRTDLNEGRVFACGYPLDLESGYQEFDAAGWEGIANDVVDLGLTREDPFIALAASEAHHGGDLPDLDGDGVTGVVAHYANLVGHDLGDTDSQLAAAFVAERLPEATCVVEKADLASLLAATAVLVRLRVLYGPTDYGTELARRAFAMLRELHEKFPELEALLVSTYWHFHARSIGPNVEEDNLDSYLDDTQRGYVEQGHAAWADFEEAQLAET